MGWKDQFTFRDKSGVKQEVHGKEFTFYPNRMSLLTEARDLSQPVAQAISVLFADESRDSGSAVKTTKEGDFFVQDVATEPITPEMAGYRQAERDKAIGLIFGTLADKRSLLLLGKLFMDSLRDDFAYAPDRPASEVEEFLYGDDADYHGLDLPALTSMLRGWMRANSKVFGEAGEQMVGLVRGRLAALQNVSPSEEGTEVQIPTPGESSKIPSSQPSDTDSQPSS